MSGPGLTAVALGLLSAFNAADVDGMRRWLAEDLVAYVTNREGGTDRVVGREDYLARITAMDLPTARFSLVPTQPPLAVDLDRVLMMVEIRATRDERSLANVAAHLLRVEKGRVVEWWMVEAKPEESDAFWA